MSIGLELYEALFKSVVGFVSGWSGGSNSDVGVSISPVIDWDGTWVFCQSTSTSADHRDFVLHFGTCTSMLIKGLVIPVAWDLLQKLTASGLNELRKVAHNSLPTNWIPCMIEVGPLHTRSVRLCVAAINSL